MHSVGISPLFSAQHSVVTKAPRVAARFSGTPGPSEDWLNRGKDTKLFTWPRALVVLLSVAGLTVAANWNSLMSWRQGTEATSGGTEIAKKPTESMTEADFKTVLDRHFAVTMDAHLTREGGTGFFQSQGVRFERIQSGDNYIVFRYPVSADPAESDAVIERIWIGKDEGRPFLSYERFKRATRSTPPEGAESALPPYLQEYLKSQARGRQDQSIPKYEAEGKPFGSLDPALIQYTREVLQQSFLTAPGPRSSQ